MSALLAALTGVAVSNFCQQVPGPKASVVLTEDQAVLGNGFTCLVMDLAHPHLSELRADFTGQGQYGKNALGKHGVALERLDADGTEYSSKDAGITTASVSRSTEELVEVTVNGVADAADAAAAETWVLSLRSGARSATFTTQGELRRDVSAKAVRHNFDFAATSIYGLFERGVVQMKAHAGLGYYASSDGLPRLYALGGPGGDLDTSGNVSISLRRRSTQASAGVVLLSSDDGASAPYSGFQEVLVGNLPEEDVWSNGWSGVSPADLTKALKWTAFYELAPNNFDFPVQGPFGDLATDGNIADADLQALLTGVYASPVGQLCTHDNAVVHGVRVGQMATTLAHPEYGYAGNYNFFDPDNYLSTAALLFSGDPYLQEQVRTVLEHNGDFINDQGQLPHHFENTTPTYVALSGQTQTGPNVFWILSCFNYAKTSGNLEWLRSYMPKLRTASAFLFDMIQPGFNLLQAPGPLMIDVFIRSNFTADTNAMAVGFLQDFADAEAAIGNSTGAVQLRDISKLVAEAMDSLLFSNETDDHYVTQLNPDGTVRDFVDYDANFIALAHGVPSPERAKKMFTRLDSGSCVHGRATYVSEILYNENETTSHNANPHSDARSAMGRIGWFDALARKRFQDQATFDSLLLEPLVADVNRWTWLHERYACDGQPQTKRTPFYFEYPSVTAMMLHYVRYGIQLGFDSVRVSPFGPTTFQYHVGNIHVEYNSSAGVARLCTPGVGVRDITVDGFQPFETYNYQVGAGPSFGSWPTSVCGVRSSGDAQADGKGAVHFQAAVGDEDGACVIDLAPASRFV